MNNDTENTYKLKYSRKPGKKYRVDWQDKENLLEYEHEGRYIILHHSILDDELYEFWKVDLAELEKAEEIWMEQQIQLQNDPAYQEWLAEQYDEWYETEEEYHRSKEITSKDTIQEIESVENNFEEQEDEEFVPVLDHMVEIQNNFDPEKESNFPISVFPSAVSDHIKEISRMFSIPYEFSAIPTLVAISTAIGNNFTLEYNSTLRQKAILYCCLVSQSSSGKSPAQKLSLAPLIKEQSKREKEYKKLLAEYLANQKSKEVTEELVEPIEPEDFITTNVTVEKIIEMLQKNSKGIVITCDEFMNFYKSLNSYKNGGGDLETYLSIWSNAYIKVNRLSRKTTGVDSPYVNIVGNLTPSSLSRLAESDNLDNGFMHRLLFSCPTMTEMVRTSSEGIREEVARAYDDFIIGLNNLTDEKSILMTPEAQNVYCQYEDYVSKSAGLDERLRSSYSKIKEYSLRFALILHVSDIFLGNQSFDSKLSKETMAKAIKIAEYFRSQVKVLYSQLAGDSNKKAEDKIQKAIESLNAYKQDKKTDTIKRRDLCRILHILVEEAEKKVIPELIEKQIIEELERKSTPKGESITYTIK